MEGDGDMKSTNTPSFDDEVRGVLESELADIDKLKELFGRVSATIVANAGQESELALAMQDRETLVKVQIKMETMKSARKIFATYYTSITGRRAWDE